MNILTIATAISFVATVFIVSSEAVAESNPIVAEFPTGDGSVPVGITSGPDGNLWFTDANAAAPAIGRITPLGVITEFPLPAGSNPGLITVGSDANLWFTDANASAPAIGRITTAGVITEFSAAASQPKGITAGPDGNLWFADFNAAAPAIGRITPAGVITKFALGSGQAPFGITVGADGNLWFTCPNAGSVGVMTTAGSLTRTIMEPDGSFGGVNGITNGPDGNIWVTANGTGPEVARITPAGIVSEFPITAQSGESLSATRITVGSDSNLWFTGGQSGPIGRMTTAGVVTLFTSGLPLFANPAAIQEGPDTNLWFVSPGISGVPSFIGRFTLPSGTASATTLVSAVLPSSRAVQFGTTATAFATVINAGSVAATHCTIQPATTLPVLFSFQTTDSKTNKVIGTINAPVELAAGASQSFVIALTPFAATSTDVSGVAPDFVPTDLSFNFACANAAAAQNFAGVNTLTFSASAVQPSDIVAVNATAGNNGIVQIPGPPGVGAFAVATTNVGAAGTITATANLGGVTLPVTLTICQTAPVTGVCMAAPVASIIATMANGAIPSFGVFAQTANDVPFSPAVNRIFVQFLDAGGLVRGSTSVAVRTP